MFWFRYLAKTELTELCLVSCNAYQVLQSYFYADQNEISKQMVIRWLDISQRGSKKQSKANNWG